MSGIHLKDPLSYLDLRRTISPASNLLSHIKLPFHIDTHIINLYGHYTDQGSWNKQYNQITRLHTNKHHRWYNTYQELYSWLYHLLQSLHCNVFYSSGVFSIPILFSVNLYPIFFQRFLSLSLILLTVFVCIHINF